MTLQHGPFGRRTALDVLLEGDRTSVEHHPVFINDVNSRPTHIAFSSTFPQHIRVLFHTQRGEAGPRLSGESARSAASCSEMQFERELCRSWTANRVQRALAVCAAPAVDCAILAGKNPTIACNF